MQKNSGSFGAKKNCAMSSKALPWYQSTCPALAAAGSANGSMSVEVQAKLQTIRMKRASPVKRTLNAKVVPLDRDTDLVDISVQRTPSVFQFAPCSFFRCATRIHLA